jgi:hypothetical protein
MIKTAKGSAFFFPGALSNPWLNRKQDSKQTNKLLSHQGKFYKITE